MYNEWKLFATNMVKYKTEVGSYNISSVMIKCEVEGNIKIEWP